MGRVVFIENVAYKHADSFLARKSCVVGLVLGQSTEQREHIVHLVRTPLVNEDARNEDKPEMVDGPKTKKQQQRREVVSIKTIENWSSDLVAQHAKQVTRMLLGGFDVLGVFVSTVSEKELGANSLARIRQMLSEIRKSLEKCQCYSKLSTNERILLHINCVPQSITCKTVDISGTLASPRPADLKIQSVPTKWHRLYCRLALDVLVTLDRDDAKQGLQNQLLVSNGIIPCQVA